MTDYNKGYEIPEDLLANYTTAKRNPEWFYQTIARLIERIAQLEAQLSLLQWTAIEEGNPKTGALCWIVWGGTVQTSAYRRSGLGFACSNGYQWEPAEVIDGDPIPDGEVTHWMPIPAPPTDKEQK